MIVRGPPRVTLRWIPAKFALSESGGGITEVVQDDRMIVSLWSSEIVKAFSRGVNFLQSEMGGCRRPYRVSQRSGVEASLNTAPT